MADRWNGGSIDVGSDFATGFVTPWNVRRFSQFNEMQTLPRMAIPGTFAEEMDGDSDVSWGPEGGRGKRRK